jgi:hypothetical protein
MIFSKKLRYALVSLMLVAAGMLGFHLFSRNSEDVGQEPHAGVVAMPEVLRDGTWFAHTSNVPSQVLQRSHVAETTPHAIDQGIEAGISKSLEKHEESEMRKRDRDGVAESARLLQTSTEFKASPGFREASAQKILPHLKSGMSAEEIVRLLGEPTEKKSDGALWRYSVFYSKTIDVYFSPQARVEKVVSVGIDAEK